MRKELIPGIVIENSLESPQDGRWPFAVFRVSDRRGAPEYPVDRSALLFPAIDEHPWKSMLVARLRTLSERPWERITRPLEWGRTAAGGLYVLQDKLEPVSSRFHLRGVGARFLGAPPP